MQNLYGDTKENLIDLNKLTRKHTVFSDSATLLRFSRQKFRQHGHMSLETNPGKQPKEQEYSPKVMKSKTKRLRIITETGPMNSKSAAGALATLVKAIN